MNLRFDSDGHTYIWCPYNAKFIEALKATFNTPEALAGAVGYDKGAEWDAVLNCWIIYTGWHGCEDWIDKLTALVSKYYTE